MSKLSKYITFSLFFLVLIIGGSLYYVFYSPHRNVETEVAIEISADSLFSTYVNGEEAANVLFLDKAIKLNGKVSDTSQTNLGQTVLIMETNNLMGSVVCTFSESIGKVLPSQKIILKGICYGFDGIDVKLGKCILLTKN